jgi:hypothetical protein
MVDLPDGEGKKVLQERWKSVTGIDRGFPTSFESARWVQARPVPPAGEGVSSAAVLIKTGEDVRRQADGLYFVVGQSGALVVADVVGIEICMSLTNFETKRHTYTERALTLEMNSSWLRTKRRVNNQERSMWEWAGFEAAPAVGQAKVRVPVRVASVLFVLKADDYAGVKSHVIPYSNEFFCKHSSLGSWDAQAFKQFLRGMTWTDQADRAFYNKT